MAIKQSAFCLRVREPHKRRMRWSRRFSSDVSGFDEMPGLNAKQLASTHLVEVVLDLARVRGVFGPNAVS
jgi:hypothetical protein